MLTFFCRYACVCSKDSETIRENGRWLTDVCQKHGFNYSHRVHIELWGDRRGV
ncbi:unnamed protein product [Chondrus crispus]|uniref:Uncharacterized protein n=1 Tax=Chondrus crispus TaxID=2769 RepID=R7Q698_CHOCR|nr:unnamed protein product [Chondrus crispus]CDF32970.1 unnamed protein product [Chondrus crispus]|eukprot:XP_005712773.1 unnamed protein product [Chondrus crispus]